MTSKTIININYKDYPECMFAVIAAFLPVHEGDDVRRVAGKVGFRSEDTLGRTYRNGLLHSYQDQPAAVSDVLHTKFWYKNGKRHRECDLPAIQSSTNSEWYKDGKRHREGGLPAVVFTDKKFFSIGVSNEWWENGQRHREGDLPAIEASNGHREWWVNGQRHREGDQPAVSSASGYFEWWVNGEFVKSERFVF
jgi:hypothetical protein